MITADKILSETQLKKFFSKLKNEKDKSVLVVSARTNLANSHDVRTIIDYYLFYLISNTGLRISEALKIQTSDIGEDFIKIRKSISKNKKDGMVYFGKTTRESINEYLKFREELYGDYKTKLLFPSKSSKSRVLSRSYIHTRFKYWLNVCGFSSSLSIHSLRHSYGTLCLDKGLSLTFVRDQLRHSSISTTSKYLHLTRENRDKVKNIF